MRVFLLGLPFALFFSSCTQQAPPPRPSTVSSVIPKTTEAPVSQTIADRGTPSTAASFPPKLTSREISGIHFEGISFDSSSHRLAVIDQPDGPGSRFPDAQSAGASRNAIAAINAGFFTPEGAPLGKLIAGGKPAGSWNRASSLGSGIFFESPSGELAIARREAVSPGAPQRELLQAGPLLIENGRAVTGLNPEKPAARIFILWDGGSKWWIGRSSICTLAQLGSALRQASPAGWQIRSALNFDGGRSADLWVSGNVPGGPVNDRSMWNRPVRNFLVLIPR